MKYFSDSITINSNKKNSRGIIISVFYKHAYLWVVLPNSLNGLLHLLLTARIYEKLLGWGRRGRQEKPVPFTTSVCCYLSLTRQLRTARMQRVMWVVLPPPLSFFDGPT